MKKLLLLGGASHQIPSIIAARKLGFSAITCDYLPDNPGHRYADEYYNVSTTDKDAVLLLAKELKINGVLCYASDPSALTAAYVAEKMGLPGNPYKSVEILSDKEKFRHFLSENNFKAPRARGYSSFKEAMPEFESFKPPVLVKPVDSSGSKGISLALNIYELEDKINTALFFSRARRVILEEYVDKIDYQVAGDGFSVNGKLVFRCFGNDHFDRNNLNPFVPVAASFPCNMHQNIQMKIHEEIQRLLSIIEMKTGAYNFDVRVGTDESIYLLEVGPRNGGCYIPQVIKYATGVDMVKYTINAAMGEDCADLISTEPTGFWSYYAIHSSRTGVLKRLDINETVMANNIVESHIYYKAGDTIQAYTGSNGTVGILLMKFASKDEMLYMMDNADRWLQLYLE